MKHSENIKALIQTLLGSDTFHALIVESIPGIGKTSAINSALCECGIPAVSIGSYATPLHLFHFICKHPHSILILDDVGSIFSDPKSMAILKAATWDSSGNKAQSTSNGNMGRRVSWGSSSDKVGQTEIEFLGKIIILTNSIPCGKETEAFLSRCLTYRIRLEEHDVRTLLSEAARNESHFPDQEMANKVINFLSENFEMLDFTKINLRTLKLGYEFAKTLGDTWHNLFFQLLPRRAIPKTPFVEDPQLHEQIIALFHSNLSPSEKEARFVSLTGKSRRTFYNYRKSLGLTRHYRHGSEWRNAEVEKPSSDTRELSQKSLEPE